MGEPLYNMWAPPTAVGFDGITPTGCEDVDTSLMWPHVGQQALTSLQRLNDQYILVGRSAPFVWQVLTWVADHDFIVRFTDDEGHYLSSFFCYSRNLPGVPADPFPIFPRITYPPGYSIRFDIWNLFAGTNNVQLVLRGLDRLQGVPQL